MSISAITTRPIFPPSPPSAGYYQPLSSFGSPPTSPEEEEAHAFTSPPGSPSYRSPPPLTLQERRARNKAASAKYRQKKNQQQNEMRQMITRLSEQNAVLERQMQELRKENERLRAAADRLRGKMVAKKMLRQWIGRHHQRKDGQADKKKLFDDIDFDLTSSDDDEEDLLAH